MLLCHIILCIYLIIIVLFIIRRIEPKLVTLHTQSYLGHEMGLFKKKIIRVIIE